MRLRNLGKKARIAIVGLPSLKSRIKKKKPRVEGTGCLDRQTLVCSTYYQFAYLLPCFYNISQRDLDQVPCLISLYGYLTESSFLNHIFLRLFVG